MFRFLLKSNRGSQYQDLTDSEFARLKKIPRYSPVTTQLYGKQVFSNDACTLIGDVKDILRKEIYRFESNNKKPIIIDCGANIGISVLFFKRLYPNSSIIAYEPDPDLFKLLTKNVASLSLKDVVLENRAVWVNDHNISFKQEGGHSGMIAEEEEGGETIIQVPSVRFKDVLQSCDNIDMLKMDIEGAENEVLFDCDSLLEKCENIFIEYHSRFDKKQQLHDILRLFNKLGYRYHVQEAFTRKRPFVDNNCLLCMDLQLNLFFKKEK